MTTDIKSSRETRNTPTTHTPISFGDMDRFVDSLIRRNWTQPFHIDWPTVVEALPFHRIPKVDVIDRETEIVVRAEIPGVNKKDIDITVGEDSITIKGSTRREDKEEKGDFYRHELTTGSFSRTVGLPAAVDGAKAKAVFNDGVVELTLPKTEKTKRHSVKVD